MGKRPGTQFEISPEIDQMLEHLLNNISQEKAVQQDSRKQEFIEQLHKEIPRYDIYDPRYEHIKSNMKNADPYFKNRPYKQVDQ